MAMGVQDLFAGRARASLLILNYHRIWPVRGQMQTRYDDGVFDTDIVTFRAQMQWLQAATTILDEDGLLNLDGHDGVERGEFFSAVTFDDGYIDCYELVKPVLAEFGIRGIFFIPFDMLESRRLGWWDVAAYLMKSSTLSSIRMEKQTYPLGPDLPRSLKCILTMFKTLPSSTTDGLLGELADACGVAFPTRDAQSSQLMDWSHVRLLQADGHAIGSHSMSHRVLATLAPEVQLGEIVDSRRRLEAVTGGSILSFAYPVGGLQHINEHSTRCAREAGYSQAFTFNTGISPVPIGDRYAIPRESAKSMALLKAKVMLPGLMGLEKRQAV